MNANNIYEEVIFMRSNWLIPLALGMVGGAYLVKVCPKFKSIIDNTQDMVKEKMCDCKDSQSNNGSQDDQDQY